MNRNPVLLILVAVSLWKAMLFLFISSDDQPLAMMIGRFPDTYTSEADCEKFLDENSKKLSAAIKDIAPREATILGVRMDCLPDESGQGT